MGNGTRRRVAWVGALGVLLATPSLAMVPAPVGAIGPTVITVTTTTDGGAGSLRAAVDTANAAVTADPIEVDLPAGTYALTTCGAPDEDGNTTGDLDLTGPAPVTIRASSLPVTVTQTCAGERVLDQRSANPLTLVDLTVSGGDVTVTDPTVIAQGGGVRTATDLELDGTTVTGNQATGAPGTPGHPGGAAEGGGVWVGGSLTMSSSHLVANTATGGPGTDEATGDDGTDTAGGDASGGGARVGVSLQLTGGTIEQNHAAAGKGGGALHWPSGGGIASGGGLFQAAVPSGTASILDGTGIHDNEALGGDAGDADSTEFPPAWPPPDPGGDALGGGAFFQAGPVATGITVAANLAQSGGAGQSHACMEGASCLSMAQPGNVSGGGLATAGLAATASTFTSNRVRAGSTFFTCYSIGCEPIGGSHASVRGGAVSDTATATISSSTFADNHASQLTPYWDAANQLRGGAVVAGTLTVTGSTFHANTAESGSGGAVSVGSLTAVTSTFDHNQASDRAGAIDAGSATLTATSVTANTAKGRAGGGIDASGAVSLTDSTVAGNALDGDLHALDKNLDASGGGIRTDGTVTLQRSTVRDNSAHVLVTGFFGSTHLPGAGGGIRALDLVATASTIAGNAADGWTHDVGLPAQRPARGGGVAVDTDATLVNTTVSGNTLVRRSGSGPDWNEGAGVWAGGDVTATMSTIADNDGGNTSEAVHATTLHPTQSVFAEPSTRVVCAAGLAATSGGYNSASDASCGLTATGDVQAGPPVELGALADNGGPVPTRAPASTSPLVDAIPPADCAETTDARGISRPQGKGCDVGAVEVPPVPSSPTQVAAQARDASVVVTWQPPLSTGESAIDGYTATTTPGGGTCTWTSGPLTCTIGGLSNGTPVTVTVTAHNSFGDSVPSDPAGPVVPSKGTGFHAVTPFRVWDSRSGPGPVGTVGPGDANAVDVPVAGVGAVPAEATAVVINVTVTGGTDASYLVASPAGAPAPTAANLLFAPGQTVPNLVTVAIGQGGAVWFTNQLGDVDVIADVVGWYDDGTAPGDRFTPITPTRALDSRTAIGDWTGPLGPGESRDLAVGGVGSVPADATAIVANVTVTGATADSYLSARPAGTADTGTANLLFAAGQTVPNLVTVGLGTPGPDAGNLTLFNQHGTVDVIVDVVGYYRAGTGDLFHPLTPTRILDDRTGVGLTGPWGPGQTRDLQITGSGTPGTIPPGATALVANLTATGGTAASYATLSPADTPNPGTAALLWAPGQTVPNLTVTGLSPDGRITITNQQGTVDLIADAAGWFAPW